MRISEPELLVDICIDPDAEPMFQVDDSINVKLTDTYPLAVMVDAWREDNGLLPMLPTLRHMTDYDQDGWYNFYIDIRENDRGKTGDAILAVVESPGATDDFGEYYIKLSDDVRKALYQKLDAESAKVFGLDFAALFAEARRYTED